MQAVNREISHYMYYTPDTLCVDGVRWSVLTIGDQNVGDWLPAKTGPFVRIIRSAINFRRTNKSTEVIGWSVAPLYSNRFILGGVKFMN